MILPVLIPSAFALPANEVYFLLAHHFTLTHNTSCERTDLTSTMFCHWTSSLWCFLGLPLPFDAYVLVSWLWVKDQIIAYIVGGGGRGVVNDALFTYTTYNITKKVFFHLLWWKIHFLSFVSNIALGLLEFLYQTYNINVLILSFGPNIWGGAVTTSFL